MKEIKLYTEKNYKIMEAILFASSSPVSLKAFSQLCEISEKETENILKELLLTYKNKGINIREVADGYEMCTNPDYYDYIEKLHNITSKQNLSKASLETLAIIAYNQPVTRVEIEEVRGVRTAQILSSLLKTKLIRILGKSDKPGRPYEYGTTKHFLRHFGLKSLDDMPGALQFKIQNDDDLD